MSHPRDTPRTRARAAGLNKYHSDQPCPRGHVGLRYVRKSECAQCVADRQRGKARERPREDAPQPWVHPIRQAFLENRPLRPSPAAP